MFGSEIRAWETWKCAQGRPEASQNVCKPNLKIDDFDDDGDILDFVGFSWIWSDDVF